MGASDYMVGNAPQGASYAAPLVGFKVGQDIADLPAAYMQGRENARTRALQDAFPNGIPRNADGSPNIDEITNTMGRIGGGQYIQQLMPFLLNQAQGQQFAKGMSGADDFVNNGPKADTGPSSSPSASGPANVKARPQNGQPTGRPPQAAEATASSAADAQPTVMKILAAQGIPNDQLGSAAQSLSRQLGVGPTDPLDTSDPRVKNVLMAAIPRLKQLGQVQQPQGAPQGAPQPAPAAPQPAPAAPQQSAPFARVSQQGQPAPGQPPAGQPGSTAPIQPRPVQTQPVAAPGQRPGPTMPDDVQDVPGFDVDTAKRLAMAEGYIRRQAASIASNNPAQAQALEKQADSYAARRQQIMDYLSKGSQTEHEHALSNTDLTPEQKNLDPNVIQAQRAKAKYDLDLKNQELTPEEKLARANNQLTPMQNTIATKAVESQMKRSDSMYQGSNARSTQFEQTLKPTLIATKAILNRPEMYTGFGGGKVLELNKVRSLLGNQNAAVLQESLSKITAQSVLSTINEQRDEMQEAGGTSARIFSQQVDQVAKAAPQMSNTLAGNRFLVNVALRMGDVATKVSQMQRDYLKDHQYLDVGFDQRLSDYLQKTPVFSDTELRDPRVLGAPDAPNNISSDQQLTAWERRMGLKNGDFFRTPDGRVKQVQFVESQKQPK